MRVAVPPRPLQVRKHLSADGLYALVRKGFAAIPDHRPPNASIPLADALQSAFAMFTLKDPSLLAFDERRPDANLKRLFGIGQIPCDTQIRAILDGVEPDDVMTVFGDVFRQVQRGKALRRFAFRDQLYLLLVDGTGNLSSGKIHCPHCLVKGDKATGKVTYAHQMLGAVLAHPDHREVLPLAPEPICNGDGATKNDCERNAAKRLLVRVRREHPKLRILVVEDALASNAPHVRLLRELRFDFLLGVKPGDHAFLFDHVAQAATAGHQQTVRWRDPNDPQVRCEIVFVNDLPLNESNQDVRVNYLAYTEYGPDGAIRKHFSWITSVPITRGNAPALVRAGRARWKIENETFNTLKNQGYHFEHNYGHGKHHLCVVFALLMFLAFLVDQVQQLVCPLFQAVWQKLGSKRALWDNLRSHFRHFRFQSMQQLYEAILSDRAREVPLPVPDTS